MFDTDKGRELYRLEDKKSSLIDYLLDKTGLFSDLVRTESKTERAHPEAVIKNCPIPSLPMIKMAHNARPTHYASKWCAIKQ